MAQTAPADVRNVVVPDSHIAAWARSAGLPDEAIVTAVAVALAESGGRIDAVGGPNFDGSRDYGLWQINEKAHPQLFEQWPAWWSVTNANMMAQISGNGTNWKPWSAYNNGSWLLYRPRAAVAALAKSPATVDANTPGSKTNTEYIWSDAVDSLQSIGGLLFKAGAWFGDPDNWIRVAEVVLGGALVVGGIAVVVRPVVGAAAAPVAAIVKGK